MKTLTIIGHLGNDAEVKEMPGEYLVINFNVAHTDSFKNKDGVKTDKTTWIQCALWRKKSQGSEIAKFLKKGILVWASGDADVSAYINKDNVAIPNLRLNVKEIKLLGGPKAATQPTATPSTNSAAPAQTSEMAPGNDFNNVPDNFSDDLPF